MTIDQDTWPQESSAVIEIRLSIDIFLGSLQVLLAPYVEGHTWRPDAGIDERAPDDFFASAKPRVDARLLWAGRTLTSNRNRDGTDLGEWPLYFSFELPGDEYTGDERAKTMWLLERFELPSLRKLIDSGADVQVWMHPPGDGSPVHVDPAATDLRLRLEAPQRMDTVGIYGFRLWGDHDRTDRALWQAPTLQNCAGDLEREAMLSLYRNVPLRASLNSNERRQRIAAAVANRDAVDEADRWAAFTLAAGRANVPRFRGQVAQAAQLVHEALGLVADVAPEDLDYPQAFKLLSALTRLVDDLARTGGTRDAITPYSHAVVDLARRLSELHPGEPDYRRALAHALMQRAHLFLDTRSAVKVIEAAAVEDIQAAVSTVEELVREEPLPWRVDEADALRGDAQAMLAEWRGSPAADEFVTPVVVAGQPARWLDPESVADVVPQRLFSRLLRFEGYLPPGVPATGPALSLREDELVGRWGNASSGPDLVVVLSELVVGLSEKAVDDLVGQVFAADGRELLECHEEAPPAGSVDRLAAASTRAFRLRLRRTDGGGPLRGFALVVDKRGLRWRVCLTLNESGEDWRARLHDDGLAAVTFTRLELG